MSSDIKNSSAGGLAPTDARGDHDACAPAGPCAFLGGGAEVWGEYAIAGTFGTHCSPHQGEAVDVEGAVIRNEAECLLDPLNTWEKLDRWVTAPCVWGDETTAGTDTQFTGCTHPVAADLEWVLWPCYSGTIWSTGLDTVIRTCSEPTPGVNYVVQVCVTGASDVCSIAYQFS